jgi:hypothetical protein
MKQLLDYIPRLNLTAAAEAAAAAEGFHQFSPPSLGDARQSGENGTKEKELIKPCHGRII